MPMLFSVVSRGTTILAEHAMAAGNFYEILQHILPQIADSTEDRQTFSHSSYMFHSLRDNKIIYLVIADKEFDQVIAFKYLSEIQKKFLQRYAAFANVALPYAMNSEFSRVINAEMKRYNVAEPSKITALQDQVEDVKKILVRNIEEVANRGEKLELLIDKTEMLSNNAVAFHRSSRSVRRNMCIKNIKWIIIVILALVLVMYIIVSAACGGPAWASCVGSKSSNHNLTGPH
ncbi:hypothetical protein HELRODRAFT_185780 [Helobdella robusta]|uniref:Vesicle-associated membrane protein 7 n=1 Tax=Helobdella robusta TaxID=6412 RepID=T1FNA2_HELRO|nr:hypothetical protein HELRODRAFT_185780 [Helobdella robusta]ESN99929.1 hypothetical protein HELRODRAFT_185780 [Helobdella robusta]